jgi:hypothetical protein
MKEATRKLGTGGERTLCTAGIPTYEKLAYLGLQCLNHPPYSPDLAPSDYHLFPGLKKQLKGLYICAIHSRCVINNHRCIEYMSIYRQQNLLQSLYIKLHVSIRLPGHLQAFREKVFHTEYNYITTILQLYYVPYDISYYRI